MYPTVQPQRPRSNLNSRNIQVSRLNFSTSNLSGSSATAQLININPRSVIVDDFLSPRDQHLLTVASTSRIQSRLASATQRNRYNPQTRPTSVTENQHVSHILTYHAAARPYTACAINTHQCETPHIPSPPLVPESVNLTPRRPRSCVNDGRPISHYLRSNVAPSASSTSHIHDRWESYFSLYL